MTRIRKGVQRLSPAISDCDLSDADGLYAYWSHFKNNLGEYASMFSQINLCEFTIKVNLRARTDAYDVGVTGLVRV